MLDPPVNPGSGTYPQGFYGSEDLGKSRTTRLVSATPSALARFPAPDFQKCSHCSQHAPAGGVRAAISARPPGSGHRAPIAGSGCLMRLPWAGPSTSDSRSIVTPGKCSFQLGLLWGTPSEPVPGNADFEAGSCAGECSRHRNRAVRRTTSCRGPASYDPARAPTHCVAFRLTPNAVHPNDITGPEGSLGPYWQVRRRTPS